MALSANEARSFGAGSLQNDVGDPHCFGLFAWQVLKKFFAWELLGANALKIVDFT